MSSAPPTSSANASAISAITNPLPNWPPDPVPVRMSPSLTDAASALVRIRNSGQSPQNMPTASVSIALNAKMRPSIAIVVARGS